MTIYRNGVKYVPKPKKPAQTLTYQGQTLTVVQWAKVKGLSYQVLRARIMHKWPLELAMETPTKAIKRLGKLRLK